MKKEFFKTGKYTQEEYLRYQKGAFYMLTGICVTLFIFHWMTPAIGQFPVWLTIVLGMLAIQLPGVCGALLGICTLHWYSSPSQQQASAKSLLHRLLLCFLLVFFCNSLMYVLCRWAGIPFEQQKLAQLLATHKTLPVLLAIGLDAVVLAPLAEELMFRIVLYRCLQGFCGGYAIVITSLVFAACHGSWHFIPALFCVGCILQHTCEHHGYAGSVLLHCLFNMIGFLAMAWF